MILRCEDPSFHWTASIKSIYSTKQMQHIDDVILGEREPGPIPGSVQAQ
ncbi:hypothetical protein [Candidatus Symbiopectobacterium sp.]|nr:hypothetical protein [Candidatus Symbiopectobacterium sp.]